ncbi:MAG: glycosyltransferase [Patescibacteria group bacterium]
MRQNIVVTTPSYRDFKNILILVKKIRKILPESKIIIVDDSPRDENLKLQKIIKNYKNILLVSRQIKSGRGSAVIEGFKEALKNTSVEYFFEIDSDLAHNPSEMPRFLNKIITKKYDVIIGSRYIKGGKTINIILSRIILSRIINIFLRFWLNIKLNDFTGGFRLYSRKSIEFLSDINLKANGFIMLSETIFLLHRNNFKKGEVPITVSIKKMGNQMLMLKNLLIPYFS